MKKIALLGICIMFFAGNLLFFPFLSNAKDTFWPTYVAPGYEAAKFLTLKFPTAAIEFDAHGNLYVSDAREFGSGWIDILKLKAPGYRKSSIYVSYQTEAYGLNGLDFDEEGNLFASEFDHPRDSGLIRKITGLSVDDTVIFDTFRPTGVATGKGGGMAEIYFPGRTWSVPDFGNIYKIESFPYDFAIVREDLVATGIAIDDSGNIFVATRDNSIWMRDPDTPEPVLIATFNKIVEELNFDSEGNLYALEQRLGTDKPTIIRLSPVECTTIQDGTLYTSDGGLIETGYDEWGYNYQAHLFNGFYCDSYRDAEWCQPYKDVRLSMKWNDAWLSNKDCDGDGLLDRYYGFDSYIGSGAWLTNHQSGTYENDDGKKCQWVYFTKIVAAPADAYVQDEIWYTADGEEIGPVIWGSFATIQSIYNDPCGGSHGVEYLSPVGPGFGKFKP